MPVAGTAKQLAATRTGVSQRRITQRSAITARPGLAGPSHPPDFGGALDRFKPAKINIVSAIAMTATTANTRNGFMLRIAPNTPSIPG